jgi:hypothetical protein
MVAVAAVAGWYIYRKLNRANFTVSHKARFILPPLSVIAFWDSTQRALLSSWLSWQTKMELEIFLQQRCIEVQHLNPNSSDSDIPLRLCGSERGPGFGVFAHQRRDGEGTRNWLCTLVFMPPSVTQSNSAICRERDVAKYQTPNIFCVKLTQSVLGVGHFAVHE